MRLRPLTIAIVFLLSSVGLEPGSGEAGPPPSTPAPEPPLGIDARIPIPEDNPLTAAKVELGRKLFFEKLLSSDGSTSCSTCHEPDHGFAGVRRLPIGVHGAVGRRTVAVQHDGPLVRGQQSDDHVDRCRLARAVRTEQTEHLAAHDLERQIIDGH